MTEPAGVTAGPRVVLLLVLSVVAALLVGAALTYPVLNSAERRRALKEAAMTPAPPADGDGPASPAPPTPDR